MGLLDDPNLYSRVASDKSVVNVSKEIPGLEIPVHDELVLSYTGNDLTGVVYKLSAVTVATLALSYTGGKLVGVIKS